MSDETEEEAGTAKAKRKKSATEGSRATAIKVKPATVALKPVRTGVTLRKKDIVDRAAEKSGVRKSDTRNAIDAALVILSDALFAGDEVVVPPLGKLRLMRQKDNGKARVATIRLQVMPEGEGDKDTLAEPEDGS